MPYNASKGMTKQTYTTTGHATEHDAISQRIQPE